MKFSSDDMLGLCVRLGAGGRYQGDADSGQFLHRLREAGHDVQHLSRQFGCAHFASSTGHHDNFVGLTQRLADLLCHLVEDNGNVKTHVQRKRHSQKTAYEFDRYKLNQWHEATLAVLKKRMPQMIQTTSPLAQYHN